MRNSSLTNIYDNWNHPSYEVRIRGTPTPPMYLWGSAGITGTLTFNKPLLLHIRNDVFGEVIQFGMVVSGTETPLGSLLPGECVAIPVPGISTGIFATCALESTVACLIKESA